MDSTNTAMYFIVKDGEVAITKVTGRKFASASHGQLGPFAIVGDNLVEVPSLPVGWKETGQCEQ